MRELGTYIDICIRLVLENVDSIPTDHFVYAPSQWETMLQCNVVSHWLGACKESDPFISVLSKCQKDFWECCLWPFGDLNGILWKSFLPEASFGLRVLSLPASVCVCVSVCLSVCQSLACPDDNSRPVQARIVKFGPKMQKTLVKVPIVLGSNWPWPSRSNLT